jgi:3D (Asp-Asp-Asp) domain-containing protein
MTPKDDWLTTAKSRVERPEELTRLAKMVGVPLILAAAAAVTAGLSSIATPVRVPQGFICDASVADARAVQPSPRAAQPAEEGEPLVFHEIVVTGYASWAAETDSTPSVTAAMTSVRPGCLALSRDLLRTFTRNAPFDFGDWVLLPGVGVFIVQDTMAQRWERRGDIWFATRDEALRWGRRRLLVGRLTDPSQVLSALVTRGPHTSTLARSISFQQ